MALGVGFVVMLIAINKGFCRGPLDQPEFTQPIQNSTVDIGKNVTFSCYVKNIQGYRVGWVKADTKAIQAIGMHVITHNPRIKVNHDRQHKWNLHIIEAHLEDAGPYMCQLNTEPMKSQMGVLKVISRTDIVEVSSGDIVFEGGTAKLNCKAQGHPLPTVYWTREDKGQTITQWDLLTGERKEVDRVHGDTLVLHKVKRSQMGNYLCIASNGFPPTVSARVRLTINFRPVINVPQPEVTVSAGEDASIECIIEAYPRGIYYWEMDTGEILSSSGKYSKQDYDIGEYIVRSRLVITNFGKDDVGVYKCVCKNNMNILGDRVEGQITVNMAPDEIYFTVTTESPETENYHSFTNSRSMEEGTTFLAVEKTSTTVAKNGKRQPAYDSLGQQIDNSNRYYPEPPVTPEISRREKYQQTTTGSEEGLKDHNKKAKNKKKNGNFFTENHATSISKVAFQFHFILSSLSSFVIYFSLS